MLNFKPKSNKAATRKYETLQNPKILEVNLVKDETSITFNWRGNMFILVSVLLLALALTLELYWGLDWWQNQEEAQATSLASSVAQIDAQVANLKNQNSAALDYKAKSAAFSALLANHVYWSGFFNWLEKNTLSSVHYTAFTGDLSGLYTLSATAPTYADVSWQTKAFLSDPATVKAEVLTASLSKDVNKNNPDQVAFTLLLQVNPSIFKR